MLRKCKAFYTRELNIIGLIHTYIYHSLVFSLEGQAWQDLEPSHVTGMALAHCTLGKFLGVVCHCFPIYIYIHESIVCCCQNTNSEKI